MAVVAVVMFLHLHNHGPAKNRDNSMFLYEHILQYQQLTVLNSNDSEEKISHHYQNLIHTLLQLEAEYKISKIIYKYMSKN